MYALSTVLFNHSEYSRSFVPRSRKWLPLWEKEYTASVPDDREALQETARQILEANGLSGGFFRAAPGPAAHH